MDAACHSRDIRFSRRVVCRARTDALSRLLGAIFFSDFALTGMMSWATYAALEVLQLLAFLAAAWMGAWLYREP